MRLSILSASFIAYLAGFSCNFANNSSNTSPISSVINHHKKKINYTEYEIKNSYFENKGFCFILSKKGVSTDSLFINDISEFFFVSYVNYGLWEARMSAPGGSGIGIRRSILFSIKDEKLVRPLDIISGFSEHFNHNLFRPGHENASPMIEKSKYEVSIKIEERTKLVISESYSHSLNEKVDSTFTGSFFPIFDDKNFIFYTAYEPLIGKYILIKEGQETPVNLSHPSVPVLQLKADKYYFLSNKWFQEGDENYLLEMY